MSERKESGARGWWEDYACGCVSQTVLRKRDLLGYCPIHGENRRNVWPAGPDDETDVVTIRRSRG